jgi:predicted lipoprotein with Yx(FWY)xxD motif
VSLIGRSAGAVLLTAGVLAATIATPALAASHTGVAKKGTEIATTHIKLGKVLANSKGRVMYLFTEDRHGVSHCKGVCLSSWPAVKSLHKPVAGRGIKAKHLGVTSHHQVTYYGHPLYYFVGDTRPRQGSGEALNDFYVVSPKGAAIKRHDA